MRYRRREVTVERLRHRLGFEFDRQIKRLRRALSAPPAEKTVVFIFGCQRSGTTMLGELFALDPDSDVYAEQSSLAAPGDPERLRLAPLADVAAAIAANRAPLVVAKPLVESQRAAEVLGAGERWRGVWLYRDVRDVVLSNMRMFGEDNGFGDLAPVVERRSDWRSDRLPEAVAERIRALHARGLARHDAAALFWVGRNAHLFAQGLDDDPRMWICRYEDLVTDPVAEMGRIYATLGRPAPPQLARNAVHARSVGRGEALVLSDEVRALCDEMAARLHDARARCLARAG